MTLETNQTALLAFPFMLIVAATSDVMTLRIPNWVTLVLAASFFPCAAVAGMSVASAGLHLAAGTVLLAFGLGLFSLKVFGGGDAKLMAAAGLWLGVPASLDFLFYTAIVGGLLALAVGFMFIVSHEAEVADSRVWHLIRRFRPDVPYGFAIAAGAILALPSSWMINNFTPAS